MKETALTPDLVNADSIPENCNYDHGKLIKYLGPIEMLVYSNSPGFLQDKYGDERVKKESSFTQILVDHEKPNWIKTEI